MEPHRGMEGLVEVEMALVGQMEYQVLDSCSRLVEVLTRTQPREPPQPRPQLVDKVVEWLMEVMEEVVVEVQLV